MSVFKPKEPAQTKLGAALRAVANTVEYIQATSCLNAADALDTSALQLGARGTRVKQLGAYYRALNVYRLITGRNYQD